MGTRRPYPITFTWLRDLGAIIDNDTKIMVWCEKCRASHEFSKDELIALSERVGRDFSLRNRRCRCRLTPGCDGWNRFCFMLGVYRNFEDVEIVEFRMARDKK